MPINHDVVGATGTPIVHSWTSKDALLYAVGVGAGIDELAFTTENSHDVPQRVLPAPCVRPAGGASPRCRPTPARARGALAWRRIL
jgi:hypothetical protein